jgi:tight adherence protein B
MILLFLGVASAAVIFIIIWKTGRVDDKYVSRIKGIIMRPLKKPSLLQNKTKYSGVGKENPSVSGNLIDYSVYHMSMGEKIRYFLIAFIVLIGAGYLFYNNILISLAAGSLAILYPAVKKKELIKKRKQMLNIQFKDALYSISSSLSAGRAPEAAFKAALEDLRILYSDSDAFIIKELEQIDRRISMNDTLENALMDFALRSGIDDIKNFADVFIICKSTGGNLVDVIRNTYVILNQKIEIKNEIDVLIAEQKLSQKILNIMPFGLLALIMASSPDYVKPLYSPAGHIAMTVVLVLLVVSYVIGSRITDIRI